MENMLVLADKDDIFGSSMSDSTRTMVTDKAKNILAVIYCFEDDINLTQLLDDAKAAFIRFAGATDIECEVI